MSSSTEIFVFGSNKAGRHGKGAAKHARDHCGAVNGIGNGRTGFAYAIPTKDEKLKPLPLEQIENYVLQFWFYAYCHPELQFHLTPIGCGLAGFRYEQIGPMFKDFPENVKIPPEFKPYI